MHTRTTVRIAALVATIALAWPATAHADDDGPSTTDEVCGASEIAQGLHRGDGRYNYWRAQRDSTWPVIEGQCG